MAFELVDLVGDATPVDHVECDLLSRRRLERELEQELQPVPRIGGQRDGRRGALVLICDRLRFPVKIRALGGSARALVAVLERYEPIRPHFAAAFPACGTEK